MSRLKQKRTFVLRTTRDNFPSAEWQNLSSPDGFLCLKNSIRVLSN